jgi:hypothetical protein
LTPLTSTDQSLPTPPLTESLLVIGNWSSTGGWLIEQLGLDAGTSNWMTMPPEMQWPAETRQLLVL